MVRLLGKTMVESSNHATVVVMSIISCPLHAGGAAVRGESAPNRGRCGASWSVCGFWTDHALVDEALEPGSPTRTNGWTEHDRLNAHDPLAPRLSHCRASSSFASWSTAGYRAGARVSSVRVASTTTLVS